MKVSFGGYGESIATFEAADGVQAGAPVKITANGTVGPCAEGDRFCGVAVSVRDGIAAVQLSGYVVLPYSGAGLAVGYQKAVAGADGKIKADAAGGEILVVDMDTTAAVCGVIL